jgi:hypothetical protein
MQIDPQAEIVLKLSDDGKAYSFKPWSYRQWRAWITTRDSRDVPISEYMDKAFAKLAEGYLGDADELQDLKPVEVLRLLALRSDACFPSPEDKKKSES